MTAWDATGKPLSGVIFLSPDAAGQGWYLDSQAEDASVFQQSPDPTVSVAAVGSAADGHYDLLTTLEHEIGHILAFDTSNPGYESRLQTVRGSQVFVGSDFTLPVAPGGELDPNLYPGDVMAATLAPGVRKLPAANEMEVVSALWGNPFKPPASPTGGSDPDPVVQTAVQPTLPLVHVAPVARTTVLDHAIAALAPIATATAIGPVPSTGSQGGEPAGPAVSTYREGHRVIVESKPSEAPHGRTKVAQQAGSSAQSKEHPMALLTPPDGSLAIQLSGSVSKNHHTTDKKPGDLASSRRES